MSKHLPKKRILVPILFASTIFAAQQTQANYVVSTVVTGPVNSNGVSNNTIEITQTGQVQTGSTMGINYGVVLNSVAAPGVTTGGTLIIDSSNTHSGNTAILVQSTAAKYVSYGVYVAPAPALGGAVIDIGSASAISADTGAVRPISIYVENINSTINNSGTISNSSSNPPGTPNIYINPAALGTVINNTLSGSIVTNSTEPNIWADAGAIAPTLTLNNSGQVTQQNGNADNILISSPFTAIINNAGGVIQNTTHGTGITIYINGGGGGDIINNLNGTISNAGGFSAFAKDGSVIVTAVGVNIGNIINAGVIQNTATLPGGSAIVLNGNATVINNSGTIEATAPAFATIYNNTAGTTILNGLINSGNIINYNLGGTAIDFGSNQTSAAVIQNGGAIQGNIFLAATDGMGGPNVFTMNGGLIAGNVQGANAHPNNTFTITGGTISGNLNSGSGVTGNDLYNISGGTIAGNLVTGPSDNTINLSGNNFINAIVGDTTGGHSDTFNITGGTFNTLTTSVAGTTIININGTYTQTGSIIGQNLLNIFVNNSGTDYTVNNSITGINDLNVTPGTTLIPNNLMTFIGGSTTGLTNNGTVLVNGSPVMQMTGNAGFVNSGAVGGLGTVILAPTGTLTLVGSIPNLFTGAAGSTIIEEISGPMGGPAIAGSMIVDTTTSGSAVLLATGSFIQPQFTGFIPQGQTFDMITVNSSTGTATITDNSTLIPYPSAVVYFTKALNGSLINGPDSILTLTAHRHLYTSLATTTVTTGIAGVLDLLAQGAGPTNNDLYTLLSQLDQLPKNVDAAMQSLTPPFNWGLIEGSHMGMDSVFEGVTDRVWDVAWHHREHGRRHSNRPVLKSGHNSGDILPLNSTFGIWFRPFAAYADQSMIAGVPGYYAKAVGGAIGVDWGANDCTTIGLAASYTNVNIDDKSSAPKNELIKSWQGTLYGSFDLTHGMFFDLMAAGASNKYDQNRVIAVNTLLTTAQADFNGTQWGIQGDLGMALTDFDYFFAPFVRLKYIHLEIDDYTEEGAAGLSLSVQNQNANEFLGGVGLRLATDYSCWTIEWVPEASAMLAYDFVNDSEQTLANFLAGGPAFSTDGIKPGRTLFDLGLGLNALYGPNLVFTAKYNLELRSSFIANSGYLQAFWNWA